MIYLNLRALLRSHTLTILLFSALLYSCSPDSLDRRIKEKKDLVDQAVSNLELPCHDGQSDQYNINGYIGEDDFCYFDGIADFTAHSAIGSIITTTEPSTQGNPLESTQTFFALSLLPNLDLDFPDGYLELRFYFPGQDSLEKEFFDFFKVGEVPFANSDFSIPGIAIEFIVLLRTNEGVSSHTLINFNSLFGSQSNSSCQIKSITSEWQYDHYAGEIEIEFAADLFHGTSNGYEGLWRGAKGQLKLPWEFYP